ncbi:hypothetical protein QBC44DRAFT_381891 [Cladorrhinum sp. PSN332]|nr:hypothetical protein QBC44DRAFT_381891 [Cladorrhinum sp. PSN332]
MSSDPGPDGDRVPPSSALNTTQMDHQIPPPPRVNTGLSVERPYPIQSRVSGTWERLRVLGRLQTKDGSQKDDEEMGETVQDNQHQNQTAAFSKDETGDACELAVLSTVLPPLLPSMDIIAIHDIDQSPETAWVYTPHKLFQKGAEDPHMQPVDEEDEPADDKLVTDARLGVGGRRRSSLNPGSLLKALKEEKEQVHGTSSITIWASQVDSQTLTAGQASDASGISQGDISPSGDPRNPFGGQEIQGKGKAAESKGPGQGEQSPRASKVERDGRPYHLEGSIPGSHSRPRTPSEKDQKSSRWLTDPTMLAGDFDRSRIMTFSYRDPEMPAHPGSSAIPDYDNHLGEIAETLLSKLMEARIGERQARTPLVLIGTGFGCLIIQKLVTLAGSREVLDTVSGIFFFDVPVPVMGEESKDDSRPIPTVFPPSPNVSSRWVKAMMGAVPKLIDSGALWESFRSVAAEKDLSVCWFYRVTAGKPINPNADIVTFVALQAVSSKLARIHGRFLGPQDPNYIRFVGQIQASLLFKVAADRELEHLLIDLIGRSLDGIYSPLIQDYKGQCPLHRAAFCGNDLAVTLLVSAYPPLTTTHDHAGLTPLHSVILGAIETNPEEQDREPYKTIIEKLLGTMAELGEMDDPKDNDSKSPWDYVQEDRHLWIRWLREPSNLLTGARAEQDERLGTLEVPVDGKLAVCRKSEAFLVQFYIAKNNSTDYLDRQRSTIYRLIYDPRYGADNLFRRNKRNTDTEKRATCRWIHLPANNEEWVRDLFTQLRRLDRSMSGKRHEGTNYYDRYLNAGAERYKQTHEVDPATNESPLPTSPLSPPRTPTFQLNSFGSPTSQKSPKLGDESFRFGHQRTHSGTFTQAPSTSSADAGYVKKAAIALFMPILGFEEHQHRMKLRSAMKRPSSTYSKDETTMLIQSYFGDEKAPLHCRRTLDQFTYHMLDDTVKRDNTQVIFKWAAKVEEQRAARSAKSVRLDSDLIPQNAPSGLTGHSYPVLMIDQLWLWVLEDEETVITSFPNTWEPNSEYNLFRYLRQDLQNNDSRPLIGSGLDLANLIIKSSVDFIRRQGPMGISLQEAFQASINDIAENQARLFDDFKTLVDRLNDEKLSQKKRAKYTNRLFQLTEETDFLAEIMDIQDELKTIKDVFFKQKEVLGQFVQLFSKGHQKKAKEKKKPKDQRGNSTTELDALSQKQQSPKVSKTREAAENNLALVNSNITAVEEMTKYADKIRTELNTLLNLKQKQANVWEARFSREGSEQTQRQGNITMVFTIVTIFFLPLSFMSSFLAIQVDSFPKDAETGEVSWPVRQAMIFLFGLSLAIIVPFTIVAFRVNQLSAYFGKYFRRFRPSAPTANLPVHNAPKRNLIRDDMDSDSDSTASERSDTPSRKGQERKFKLDKTRSAWRNILPLLGVGRSPAGSVKSKKASSARASSPSRRSVVSRRLFPRNHLYAPLFGWEGWYLHTRIPWVRRWWKYKMYEDSMYGGSSSSSVSRSMKSQASQMSSESSSSRDRWHDRVVRDYPLHRVMGPVWESVAKMGRKKDKDEDDGIEVSEDSLDLQWWSRKGAAMTGRPNGHDTFYGTAREWAVKKASTFRKPAPRIDLEKGLPL